MNCVHMHMTLKINLNQSSWQFYIFGVIHMTQSCQNIFWKVKFHSNVLNNIGNFISISTFWKIKKMLLNTSFTLYCEPYIIYFIHDRQQQTARLSRDSDWEGVKGLVVCLISCALSSVRNRCPEKKDLWREIFRKIF